MAIITQERIDSFSKGATDVNTAGSTELGDMIDSIDFNLFVRPRNRSSASTARSRYTLGYEDAEITLNVWYDPALYDNIKLKSVGAYRLSYDGGRKVFFPSLTVFSVRESYQTERGTVYAIEMKPSSNAEIIESAS